MTHGQCDARPTVTFPAAERHRPLAGTKLYCLVTEAHGCEQLAQSCYLVADWPGVKLAIFRSRANALTTEPPSHARLKVQRKAKSETKVTQCLSAIMTDSPVYVQRLQVGLQPQTDTQQTHHLTYPATTTTVHVHT